MKDLKETAGMMSSPDYKERFRAEYHQLETRFLKLRSMCLKWDAGTLEFTPTCPREIYDKQLYFMEGYLEVLVERAKIESIELNFDEKLKSKF